jgi:hypothetical protein
MMAFLEELAASILISLGIRAATSVAGAMFAGRTAKPEPPRTCSSCGKVMHQPASHATDMTQPGHFQNDD